MDCLKKALKLADISMTSSKNLYLFVLILNKYLYYFSLGVEFVRQIQDYLTLLYRSMWKI